MGKQDHLTFTLTPGMAPAAPLMALLARFDRPKVEAFAEISIALLDLMEPDPDLEDGGDDELAGDEDDGAWVEWTTKPVKQRRKGQAETTLGEEDDELAGDETDGNGAEDEECAWFAASHAGPGCRVGDEGIADNGGFYD